MTVLKFLIRSRVVQAILSLKLASYQGVALPKCQTRVNFYIEL